MSGKVGCFLFRSTVKTPQDKTALQTLIEGTDRRVYDLYGLTEEGGSMNRVKVKPAVLQWAVERSGIRSALARTFPKLGQWLTGDGGPTMKQLEALGKATLTPFGYFFLDEPPEEKLPIPLFRTLDDQPAARPSAELLKTVYTMEPDRAGSRLSDRARTGPACLCRFGHAKDPAASPGCADKEPWAWPLAGRAKRRHGRMRCVTLNVGWTRLASSSWSTA